MTKRVRLSMASSLLSLAFATGAQAQVPSAAAGDQVAGHTEAQGAQSATDIPPDGERALQDIVVTAQKRAENVQSTPIAMSVATGREIAAKAQGSLDAVLRNQPSVEVQGLAQGAQLYIRGVGSSVDPGFADPAIALMVDGVYNGRTESITSGAYDIDRIEVLRGPQGTLYGRNASGGSVNVITANPRLGELSGYARGQLGTYALRRGEGALNVPIASTLAVRLAGYRETRHGYVDDGSYDSDSWGVRGKILWEPTSWLRLLAKGDYYRETGKGVNTVPVPGSAGNLTFPPPFFFSNFDPTIVGGPPFTGGVPIQRFPNGYVQRDPGNPWSNNPEHVPGYIDRKAVSFSLQADADLGFATLTVLPSYSRNRNILVSSFLFGSILPGVGPTYTINSNYTDTIQNSVALYKSIELRLASNNQGPLRYLLGFYYLRTQPGAALTPQTTTTNNGGTLVFDIQERPGSTVAGFGQVTYSVTPRLRLTGGLRVSQDRINESNAYTLNGVAGPSSTFSQSQTSVQYKAGFEYDVAARSLLYGHVASGFKQGGISPTFPSIAFKPEHLTAFEAGLKNRFLDNRLQLNLAGFYYLYRDYQFQVFQTLQIGTQDATANFPVIGNAGQSHVAGGEAEFDVLPWHNGHLHGSLTYLDARYGAAVLPNSPFANQGLFDLKGRQIQNAPHWASNLGFDQDFDLGRGKVTASVNTHLSTGYYVTPEQYLPGAYQSDYSRTDLFLRYVAPKDRWTIGVFLKNVEGEAQTTYVFPAYRRFITAPRTVGVTAGVNF